MYSSVISAVSSFTLMSFRTSSMYLISNSSPLAPVTPTGITVWDRWLGVVSAISSVVMYSVLLERLVVGDEVAVVEVEEVEVVEEAVIVVVVVVVDEDDLIVVVVLLVVIGVVADDVFSVVILVVAVDVRSSMRSGVVVCSNDKIET